MNEYLRTVKSDPDRAKLLNIRYTGLQAYSIMEGYERMKAGMRLYRQVSGLVRQGGKSIADLYAGVSPVFRNREQLKQMLATDVAFYMGWVGHYAADASMPLHDSIHHDGWVGDNPKGYTTDPSDHGRFEEEYVDLVGETEADVLKYVAKTARYLKDPWEATLKHSLDSRNFVEDVYRLDLRHAFENKNDPEARELVSKRIAAGAEFLRLAYTAWIDSAHPAPPEEAVQTAADPENPENPRYNPATGSAPAPPKQ
jgi:hypothetical protein